MSGTAAMRWRVYGWAAPANSSAVGPCSTTRPAYITATRSARLATTARSWVTYSAATPWVAAQVADGGQHVGLRGDVEPGGRLVEHDDARPAGERHRQTDALLLAARELVRVAPQELRRRRQQDLAHHLLHARPASRRRSPPKSCASSTSRICALDAQRRVERRARVLRHVADQLAPAAPQLGRAQADHRASADLDRAAVDAGALAGVAEHGQADGRLARAGLADQAEHLAGADRQRHLVDDVVAAGGDVDAQRRRWCRRGARSSSAAPGRCRRRRGRGRRRSSPTPTVSRAMAKIGSSVPHGCWLRARRFSLIICAQSGRFRPAPRPRNAERADEDDRVGQAQVGLDEQRAGDVGQHLRARMRERDSPSASAAPTKSRSTTPSAAPRVTRATRG